VQTKAADIVHKRYRRRFGVPCYGALARLHRSRINRRRGSTRPVQRDVRCPFGSRSRSRLPGV